MSRHDYNLAAHIAVCRSDDCTLCPAIAEDRANPEPLSDYDERHWASAWENRQIWGAE